MKGKVLVSLGVGALCTSSFAGLTSLFDFNGSLNPTYNSGHAAALEFYKGGTNPSANGTPTYVSDTVGSATKQVAAFGKTEGFKAFHGIGKNGGGDYGNLFSILMDVKLTATTGTYASILQTNETNSNDGDLFWRDGNGLGTIGDYGNSTPPFALNEWHRIVSTWDLTSSTLNLYVDGNLANTVALSAGVDGRWALYTWDDPDAYDYCWIFMDEDGDNGAGYISSLAFYDNVLSANDVALLGGVGQPVPEPATMIALGIGALGLVSRRRRK